METDANVGGRHIIQLFALNSVDALLTYYQINYLGAYEANPVMSALIAHFPNDWVSIKVAVVTLLLSLLFILPIQQRRLSAINGVVLFITSVYSLVVGYHIYLIMTCVH